MPSADVQALWTYRIQVLKTIRMTGKAGDGGGSRGEVGIWSSQSAPTAGQVPEGSPSVPLDVQ